MNEEKPIILKKDELEIEIIAKKNKIKIGYILITLILSLLILFFTKNLAYFILCFSLFLAIYFIIYSKSIKVKKRVAFFASLTSGILAGIGIFTYFYNMWILPFMLNVLHLPALDIITKESATFDRLADIFLVIGTVFAIIAIGFTITWYIISKKELKNKK